MSGSVTPTGPLTDAERVAARRFLGYAAAGSLASNQTGYRFFQSYGSMEYRLTNAAEEEWTVIRTYLTQLTALELAIFSSGENLDTDQAAVWHRNKSEVRDRERLFDNWRRRLCGFLGLPPGPELGDGGTRIVV